MIRLKTVGLLFFLVVLTACSPTQTEKKLSVTEVWGRTSPMSADNGAFYMTITNDTAEADALLSASVETCGNVELHEMYEKGDKTMGMRPVSSGKIEIPAGKTVELKVGGLHIMCLGKKQAFEVGQQIPLTLQFEKAGSLAVTAEIRE